MRPRLRPFPSTGWAAALVLAVVPWAARAGAPDVSVSNGRLQVIMASRPAAGYFVLRNRGDQPLTLTGARAADCGSIMLHKSSDQGGMAHMDMVDAVPVPAGDSVRFAPGGYHLMCMDPKGILLSGNGTETVTLLFAGGGEFDVPFAIKGVGR